LAALTNDLIRYASPVRLAREMSMTDESHFRHSSLREKVLEHLFVGDLLRCLWRKGVRDIELLRAEVDAGGYDLVLDCNGVSRHIQLKASHKSAKTRRIPVNTRLMTKPCGCVVWVMFDAASMELGPFFWFGGKPGRRLPGLGTRVGRHTRGSKTERPAIRILKRGQLTKIASMDELVRTLIGDPGRHTRREYGAKGSRAATRHA
jgi:hypothetical protein